MISISDDVFIPMESCGLPVSIAGVKLALAGLILACN